MHWSKTSFSFSISDVFLICVFKGLAQQWATPTWMEVNGLLCKRSCSQGAVWPEWKICILLGCLFLFVLYRVGTLTTKPNPSLSFSDLSHAHWHQYSLRYLTPLFLFFFLLFVCFQWPVPVAHTHKLSPGKKKNLVSSVLKMTVVTIIALWITSWLDWSAPDWKLISEC